MKKVFALLLACLLLACSALAEESVAYVNNSRGLIVRQEHLEVPVRVEYDLTEKSKRLQPILMELIKWSIGQ